MHYHHAKHVQNVAGVIKSHPFNDERCFGGYLTREAERYLNINKNTKLEFTG